MVGGSDFCPKSSLALSPPPTHNPPFDQPNQTIETLGSQKERAGLIDAGKRGWGAPAEMAGCLGWTTLSLPAPCGAPSPPPLAVPGTGARRVVRAERRHNVVRRRLPALAVEGGCRGGAARAEALLHPRAHRPGAGVPAGSDGRQPAGSVHMRAHVCLPFEVFGGWGQTRHFCRSRSREKVEKGKSHLTFTEFGAFFLICLMISPEKTSMKWRRCAVNSKNGG